MDLFHGLLDMVSPSPVLIGGIAGDPLNKDPDMTAIAYSTG